MGKFMDKLKDLGSKLMNGGYTPLENAMAVMMGIEPKEYRALVEKEKLKTYIHPTTGARCQTQFHNSKYLPDGTKVEPGTPAIDLATTEARQILTWNERVSKNPNVNYAYGNFSKSMA